MNSEPQGARRGAFELAARTAAAVALSLLLSAPPGGDALAAESGAPADSPASAPAAPQAAPAGAGPQAAPPSVEGAGSADPADRTVSTGQAAGAPQPAPGSRGTGLSSDVVYAVLVAEIAMQRDDYHMAFTHYRHAARLTHDPELVGLAAYAGIEAGELDGAQAELAELIREEPASGAAYLRAAQLLARVPDAAKRVEMMEELVARAGDDAEAHYALAMLAAGSDDLQAAREHAETAARLRPHWNAPRVFLVRLLATSEQTDAAVATLDEFLAQEPHDQELQLLRAQLHLDAQEYDAALALFDDILAHGPGQPDVLLTAAMVALEVDALDKARDYLTALRATGARPGEAAFLLGQVEEKAGNLDEALEWYDKVDGENETNARVQSAGILAEQGEMGRAREILHQLRASFPSDSPALYLIEGELLREHAREQEAVDVYTEALADMPDNADLLYARAMVEVGMDRVDLLERDLRRILVDDPDHVDALNALGYTLADRTDRLAEAKSLIERAYQLRPEEPAILDSMGWVLFRSGDAQSAEPYLRKALAATFDPEIAAHLGEVLWALGRKAEARQVWDRALAEDPEHEYLLRTLGRYRFSQTTQ